MEQHMKKYIAALDQGTTSSRAIIFDREQRIVSLAQRELKQIYPRPGFVEHDPMEIYSSQLGVLTEAIMKKDINPADIAAVGITNQRETTVLWEKSTGRPVHNAIVWQCRRSADICEDLKAAGLGGYIQETTGLVPDAYFSATKIKWLLDNIPGLRARAQRGEILFGTVDSWLIWKLTGVHVTDYTNASRTMLFNINTLAWDDTLLRELDIPRNILPEVCSSSQVYGCMNISGVNVPVAGAAGDQHAALFGQQCFKVGSVKNTYGTGCFLLMNTGERLCPSRNGLVSTIGIAQGGRLQYALEGSVFAAGAVVQWLRDELGIIPRAADSETMAAEDNGGVYLVPAFAGLGAPYWDMYARGTILGLTRGTGRGHIIRAALESIAYQTKAVLDAMEADTGMSISGLKADGGASANGLLMQFQADILNKPVERPPVTETTALGAAYLAGLGVGMWSLEDIEARRPQCDVFRPGMEDGERQRLLEGWNKAVKRSMAWSG